MLDSTRSKMRPVSDQADHVNDLRKSSQSPDLALDNTDTTHTKLKKKKKKKSKAAYDDPDAFLGDDLGPPDVQAELLSHARDLYKQMEANPRGFAEGVFANVAKHEKSAVRPQPATDAGVTDPAAQAQLNAAMAGIASVLPVHLQEALRNMHLTPQQTQQLLALSAAKTEHTHLHGSHGQARERGNTPTLHSLPPDDSAKWSRPSNPHNLYPEYDDSGFVDDLDETDYMVDDDYFSDEAVPGLLSPEDEAQLELNASRWSRPIAVPGTRRSSRNAETVKGPVVPPALGGEENGNSKNKKKKKKKTAVKSNAAPTTLPAAPPLPPSVAPAPTHVHSNRASATRSTTLARNKGKGRDDSMTNPLPNTNVPLPHSQLASHPPSSSLNQTNRVWSTNSAEDREKIKHFWLKLAENERRELISLEKIDVLRKMRDQQRGSCSCAVCGRKRRAIEEELTHQYDVYYQELQSNAKAQQLHLAEPAKHPLSPGAGPFPGSVAIDAPDGPILPRPPALPQHHHHHHHHHQHSHPPHHQHLLNDESLEDDEYEDDEDFDDEDDYDDEYDDDDVDVDAPIANRNSTNLSKERDYFNLGNSLTVKGILTVADDLLRDDAQKFLEMMEQLAEKRMQGGDVMARGRLQAANKVDRPVRTKGGKVSADALDDELDPDKFDAEEDAEFEDEEDGDPLNEEQRLEEGRRMFHVFAARLFEQRVLGAYRERVAQEKQMQLLRELEEEDLSKAQKEAKKLKEKEKKKDKKKAAQQKRDEEKARKDAEKAAEEAAAKAKADELQNAERARREEDRLKKEAERKAKENERNRLELERRKKEDEEKARLAEKERKKQVEIKQRQDAERLAQQKQAEAKDRALKEEALKKEAEAEAAAKRQKQADEQVKRAKEEQARRKEAIKAVPSAASSQNLKSETRNVVPPIGSKKLHHTSSTSTNLDQTRQGTGPALSLPYGKVLASANNADTQLQPSSASEVPRPGHDATTPNSRTAPRSSRLPQDFHSQAGRNDAGFGRSSNDLDIGPPGGKKLINGSGSKGNQVDPVTKGLEAISLGPQKTDRAVLGDQPPTISPIGTRKSSQQPSEDKVAGHPNVNGNAINRAIQRPVPIGRPWAGGLWNEESADSAAKDAQPPPGLSGMLGSAALLDEDEIVTPRQRLSTGTSNLGLSGLDNELVHDRHAQYGRQQHDLAASRGMNDLSGSRGSSSGLGALNGSNWGLAPVGVRPATGPGIWGQPLSNGWDAQSSSPSKPPSRAVAPTPVLRSSQDLTRQLREDHYSAIQERAHVAIQRVEQIQNGTGLFYPVGDLIRVLNLLYPDLLVDIAELIDACNQPNAGFAFKQQGPLLLVRRVIPVKKAIPTPFTAAFDYSPPEAQRPLPIAQSLQHAPVGQQTQKLPIGTPGPVSSRAR